MPGNGCPGKFYIRCPGNRKIWIFGFPEIRTSGDLEVWKSENPDLRISGNPDFRKSENPDFPISGASDVEFSEASDARHRRCPDPSKKHGDPRGPTSQTKLAESRDGILTALRHPDRPAFGSNSNWLSRRSAVMEWPIHILTEPMICDDRCQKQDHRWLWLWLSQLVIRPSVIS